MNWTELTKKPLKFVIHVQLSSLIPETQLVGPKTLLRTRPLLILSLKTLGNVLSRENIEAVVRFAESKKLFVFADEVYQVIALM